MSGGAFLRHRPRAIEAGRNSSAGTTLDCRLSGWLAVAVGALLGASPGICRGGEPGGLFGPCDGACGVVIYAGGYVEDSLGDDIILSPSLPTSWEYAADDRLIAGAVSREVAHFWRHWALEPEVGLARRFGRQSATEVWGALFFRYSRFPWDRYVVTTAALSTGLNWASEVTEVEASRAQDGEGDRLMHFFSPEVTFAAPARPDLELVFRFHHRSGVFGLVSDAWGGAQYATVGLRIRF